MLQVKSTDEEGLSPPNLLVIDESPERGYGSERHYIPYVPQIVKEIDTRTQELLVKPPKGLLQLGRERAALKYVEPLLKVQTFTAMHTGELVHCCKGEEILVGVNCSVRSTGYASHVRGA